VLRLLVPLIAVGLLAVGAKQAGGVAGTLPALSIDDVTVTETDFDIVAPLTATLAPASNETVTVHYATADGSADSTDYVADSGTLTFAPGNTTARIPVLIKGDALDEPDETVFVDLSNAEHATIADGRGVVTIVDSDPTRLLVVDAAVRVRWNVHRKYTRVTQLVVTLPAGAAIEARCVGRGCPFSVRRSRPNVTPLFGVARLRPRTTIQLLVDYPGQIGKVFKYTIRAGRNPRVNTLCLPPGATKPTAC
jgi:Calx-beta domain